ncbi:MAG: hypothetical protein U5R31_07135 [Acidimicrobiia bacterium]|nr:hypothetical protein [Acidimicrobiia bacterium]
MLATNLLGVERICLIHHTDCAVVGSAEDQVRARVRDARGLDPAGWEFLATTDADGALREDLDRLRTCELLAEGTEIGAFVFDVHTGALRPVDGPEPPAEV